MRSETTTNTESPPVTTGVQRLPMSREAVIAAACEAAKNPYASSHMNASVQNLIAFLIEHPSPSFQMPASPSDANYARRWLEQFARMADELPFNVGRDAGADTGRTVFSDALHDADLPNGEAMMEAAE